MAFQKNSFENSQKTFIDTLRDMNEILEGVKSRLLKYEDANALRKMMMGSDVKENSGRSHIASLKMPPI